MEKPIKSHLKRLLGIALYSLGGLSTIIGVLLAAHALDLASKGASRFIPFALISASTLVAGIYLLLIRRRKPLAEWRKMPAEERAVKDLIGHLQARKGRIAALSFLLVVIVSSSVWLFWREHKLNQMGAPEQVRGMASFEDLKYELPILFSRFYIIAAVKAKLIFWECTSGLFTGFLIVMLINELAGFTRNKHKLTLCMWKRIKQLEDEVERLKAHVRSDDRQIDGQDEARPLI